MRGYGKPQLLKEMLGLLMSGNPDFYSSLNNKLLRDTYENEILPRIVKEETQQAQRKERNLIQKELTNIFFTNSSIPKKVREKNSNIALFKPEIVGTGYGMSDNTYIKIFGSLK